MTQVFSPASKIYRLASKVRQQHSLGRPRRLSSAIVHSWRMRGGIYRRCICTSNKKAHSYRVTFPSLGCDRPEIGTLRALDPTTLMTRYRVRVSLRRSSRTYSTNAPTISRPFAFHIGASFVGKPAHPDDKPIKSPGFPEGPIKKWRDRTLAWPKGLATVQAGHDFFYVQEVCHP